MKRNGQMQRAGVPKAGQRPWTFFGWKKPNWRAGNRLIDLRHASDLRLSAIIGRVSAVEKSGYHFTYGVRP